MDSTQRQELKRHMAQRLAELTSQLPSLREGSQPVAPDSSLGRLTRLDAIQGKEMTEAALRQTQAELAGLTQALQRIDQPGFGLCEACEEPIPMGRLKAMPTTTLCVKCA